MNTKLISMFHMALREPGAEKNFAKVNEQSMKYGYIIHPECCTKDVVAWLKEQSFNPNATFYKEWSDITSKTRFELLVDQLIHYATTYGTDFALGNGYVPNDEPVVIPYDHFKVITPAEPKEIFDKCMGMLKSGIALKPETIDVIVEYFTEYGFIKDVNLDEVSNKEAQAILSEKLGILPRDEFGMLRCIVYRYTGAATLIKDANTLYTIKGKNGFQYNQRGSFDLSTLKDNQLKILSRIFYRYKPIFLAMKGTPANNKAVNKIRKYADAYHKPLVKGFWETCLTPEAQGNEKLSLYKASKEVENLNNYRKIQLMQSIKERLLGKDHEGKMFIIRNGKMFVRDDYVATCNTDYLVRLYNLIEESVVKSLAGKVSGYNVMLPKSVELSCPTSEKNFIGNLPFGSYVPMKGDHNIFGIYWRNEWGARDLDLWYTDKNGNRYGWCSGYYDENHTLVFSGDMTNADPEATELFYVGKDAVDGNIGVNVFSGGSKCKFKILVANEDIDKSKFCNHHGWGSSGKAYMVDPNDIVFETELEFKDGGLKKIGVVTNNKIVLADLAAGAQRVTTSANADIIQQQMRNKVESYVDLKPLLEKAGANVIYDPIMVPSDLEDPNSEMVPLTEDDIELIDLSNPSKDDLIKLFA